MCSKICACSSFYGATGFIFCAVILFSAIFSSPIFCARRQSSTTTRLPCRRSLMTVRLPSTVFQDTIAQAYCNSTIISIAIQGRRCTSTHSVHGLLAMRPAVVPQDHAANCSCHALIGHGYISKHVLDPAAASFSPRNSFWLTSCPLSSAAAPRFKVQPASSSLCRGLLFCGCLP